MTIFLWPFIKLMTAVVNHPYCNGHRDLHGRLRAREHGHPGDFSFVVDLQAPAKLQRKFKAINMSMTNRMTFS